ncbi:hypothetical protein S40288_05630 [Stachybotrys chartarum IBT 40288]|nr:hypothetical protein S40288_05630 [Stachybotrys chartarum IBT 40288]
MRGKRSKQYRKLMEQFSMTFGFREPYQIIVDAEMVKDACRFKMDLEAGLQRTVHGKVKTMITQCEIRKLYAQNKEPGVHEAIELAKTFERRRCGHHPDEYPEPLDALQCLQSVVDPKSTGQNKNRYVVASQSQEVRRMLRGVRGVPLIYIKRSVMILEPMADESVALRLREEKGKFRAEIKKALGKRKRDEKELDSDDDQEVSGASGDQQDKADGATSVERSGDTAAEKKKQRKGHGPKGPNPLAAKKKKKKSTGESMPKKSEPPAKVVEPEGPGKRKRRKKAKTETATAGDMVAPITTGPAGEES